MSDRNIKAFDIPDLLFYVLDLGHNTSR
jgi:hypothetical protein